MIISFIQSLETLRLYQHNITNPEFLGIFDQYYAFINRPGHPNDGGYLNVTIDSWEQIITNAPHAQEHQGAVRHILNIARVNNPAVSQAHVLISTYS